MDSYGSYARKYHVVVTKKTTENQLSSKINHGLRDWICVLKGNAK